MYSGENLNDQFPAIAFRILAEVVGVDAVGTVLHQAKLAREAGWQQGVTAEEHDPEAWWKITTTDETVSFVVGAFQLTLPIETARTELAEMRGES